MASSNLGFPYKASEGFLRRNLVHQLHHISL